MATRLTSLNSYRSGGSYGGGETPAQALDANTGTKLCNTNFSSIAPYWMVLDAGAVYYPSSYYRIYSANDAPERDPRNWLLQGSYNNVDWVTIDTVSGQGSWGSRQSMLQFTNDNYSVPYRYYRWYCSAIQSGSIMQISELQIFVEGIARSITVSAGAGGSVSPGSGYVQNGTSKTWTITPDAGYEIESITYGGASQTITDKTGMDFTDASVDADATLAVTFKKKARPGFLLFM